jgi:large subunit ribosomal protein L9
VKIILTREVPNLGKAGDVKNVAAGYARNYLFPRDLAVPATPGNLKDSERHRAAAASREERLAEQAEALAERLSAVTLTFEAKAGEKGRLYGSITPAEIAEALERETGEKLDRHKHILGDPIRQTGRHTIQVRLRADVVADVAVVVKPEGGELPEEAPVEQPVAETGPAEEQ